MKNYLGYILFFILPYIISAQPDFVWAKGIGGSGPMYGKSITTDNSGNIYTTGYFSGTVDFDPGPGIYNLNSTAYDAFIMKLDSTGNLIWAKQFSGPISEGGTSVTVDFNENVYVTGYFMGTVDFDTGPGVYNLISTWNYSSDIFVCKLNSSGNLVWAKRMGGTNNEYSYSIAVDKTGNVYTTGQFEATVDFDPGALVYNLSPVAWVDMFISKLDSIGNFAWAKSIGGKNWDYSVALSLDKNNNVYTTGYYSDTVDFDPGVGIYNLISEGGSEDAFVNKLDKDGNFIWAKSFSGPSNYGRGFSLAIDLNGNVLTTGMFKDTVDFDPGTGTFFMYTPSQNFFGTKLDSMGNFVWAKLLGGSDVHITTDLQGNIYTTGDFMDTCDFDPGPGNFFMMPSPITTQSSFICQLDNMGNFICAGQTIGYSSQTGNSISVHRHNIYVIGDFNGMADFDPGSGVFNLSSSSTDIFISKLNNCSLITEDREILNKKEISLYPNPSYGCFTIKANSRGITKGKINFRIYNTLGQILFSKQINSFPLEGFVIDIGDEQKGIYFLEIENDNQCTTQKIVIQ